MDNNVCLTTDDDGNRPHLRYDVPSPAAGQAAWYECFDSGETAYGWVVLGWIGHEDDDDLECVESYDDFSTDAAAALRKFAEIVCGKRLASARL